MKVLNVKGSARRLRRGGICVAVMLGLLTACSSGPESEPPSSGPTSTPPVVAMKPPKDLLKDVAAKHRHVKLGECRQLAGGGVSAQGTVKNTDRKKATYKITVAFKADGKVVNWAETSVEASGRSTVPWVAEKRFTSNGDLECVVRAVS